MQSTDLVDADIILTSRSFADSKVSGIIKVGTLSPYSHAMLYAGNGLMVEAIGEGIVTRVVAEAIAGCDKRTVYRHSGATPDKQQRIIAFAMTKLGGKYAMPGVLSGSGLAVVGYAPVALPLMLGRTLTNAAMEAMGKKRSYFCSELVTDAYLSVGLALGIYGRTPSLMNPGDIGEYSDRNPTTLQKMGELE